MSRLVSIVLPVYNGEQFLKESIDSVLNQTYQNWELLVVDDCSTDSTPSIVSEYVKKDNRIKYYRNEKNLRLPGNLNRGFSLTKGEYLTWTSDDNKYRQNALEVMVKELEKDREVQLVYASYQIIDENGKKISELRTVPNGEKQILGSNVVGACFMYTRKVYEQVGNYDEELLLVEDFDYWQRVFMNFKAKPISEILYDYRWHDATLTSTKRQEVFGARMEKMLLKNRPGFGKLDIVSGYFYYSCLKRSRKDQGKKNTDIMAYYVYSVLYFFYHRILKK